MADDPQQRFQSFINVSLRNQWELVSQSDDPLEAVIALRRPTAPSTTRGLIARRDSVPRWDCKRVWVDAHGGLQTEMAPCPPPYGPISPAVE